MKRAFTPYTVFLKPFAEYFYISPFTLIVDLVLPSGAVALIADTSKLCGLEQGFFTQG